MRAGCLDGEPIWSKVNGEWRHVYGSFGKQGISVEWHDFECGRKLDWGRSFHPDSLEICVNFEGSGAIREADAQVTSVCAGSVAHYTTQFGGIRAERRAAERHRFLTIEMSRAWLARSVTGHEAGLNWQARSFLDGAPCGCSARGFPMDERMRRSAEEIVQRPVRGAAAGFWFHAKVLEIAAQALAEPESELFCQRQKRLASQRVESVKRALARDMENPPCLSQLGREAGCSPFYLSRIFSEQTGMTISRYLRTLRLDRAADLLREGKCNVTEAAMAVGYSSLSHFSKAFAERFGECPCVFPLRQPSP